MPDPNSLFYVCSLIEFIGRQCKLRRGDVVQRLGKETLSRIYRYADTFHCEPIAKVADDFIRIMQVPSGDFDNVATCKYEVPSYWDIGKVYARLIEDTVSEEQDPIEKLIEVYGSWVDAAISRYNSDLFYQPREYLAQSYKAGALLAA